MSIRLRLTLLYSGLFLAAGLVLIAMVVFIAAPTALPAPPVVNVPGPGLETYLDLQRSEDRTRLLTNSAIALGVMAALSMALGWLMAGRVLRPVAEMTAAVRRITSDSLAEGRLAATGPDDELKRLADTFDDLLARLDTAFTAQRRFVANASHELRTPLTLQQAMVEVTLADPSADPEELRHALGRVLAAGRQQERLIQALLALARGQQGLDGAATVDLASLVVVPDGLRVERDLRPALVYGDADLLAQLVANLLANAVRHNVPGGWVRISTGGRTLEVANSGPVIPAEEIPRLLQPFQRLAPGRRTVGDGHGLGLSIVAAIADAHRASLTAEPLPGGGLRVVVTFP